MEDQERTNLLDQITDLTQKWETEKQRNAELVTKSRNGNKPQF
jgi:hypothetical protein